MINIKKFSKAALMGCMVATASMSCTDLEVELKDSVLNTPGEGGGGNAGELLNNLYNGLSQYTDQGTFYSLNQHTTAQMIPPTRGVDWGDNGVWRTLHAHTWDATHSQVLNAWNDLNGRSFICEQVLGANPTPLQAAQAKGLRSMFMWHLMDLYGQVPRRTLDQGVDDLPMVMTRSEAFDFIVKGLEEALPNLPAGSPTAETGVFSKAAANTLLARLYLNKAVYKAATPAGPYTFDAADMAKVVQYADAVTASGYALDADFFNPFTAGVSKDRIMTTLANGVPRNRWMMTMHYDQGGFEAERDGPWNGFATLASFYDTFDAADNRRFKQVGFQKGYGGLNKGFLIGQQFKEDKTPIVDSRSKKPLEFTRDVPLAGAATNKGIRVIKYHPTDKGVYMIMRYSDVYLMRAEALMRSNKTADALTAVNALRKMRNIPALTALTADDMFNERGRELYWEGIARTDEIRNGKFNTKYQDVTNLEAYTVLFPIPSIAISSNTNLSQNPGY